MKDESTVANSSEFLPLMMKRKKTTVNKMRITIGSHVVFLITLQH